MNAIPIIILLFIIFGGANTGIILCIYNILFNPMNMSTLLVTICHIFIVKSSGYFSILSYIIYFITVFYFFFERIIGEKYAKLKAVLDISQKVKTSGLFTNDEIEELANLHNVLSFIENYCNNFAYYAKEKIIIVRLWVYRFFLNDKVLAIKHTVYAISDFLHNIIVDNAIFLHNEIQKNIFMHDILQFIKIKVSRYNKIYCHINTPQKTSIPTPKIEDISSVVNKFSGFIGNIKNKGSEFVKSMKK